MNTSNPQTEHGWYCAGFLGDWQTNDGNGVCAGTDFVSASTCVDQFKQLWSEQKAWLERGLSDSYADWQIVVTHYPAYYGLLHPVLKPLAKKYGIDLIVTGHSHLQAIYGPYEKAFDAVSFGATGHLVSGGGG